MFKKKSTYSIKNFDNNFNSINVMNGFQNIDHKWIFFLGANLLHFQRSTFVQRNKAFWASEQASNPGLGVWPWVAQNRSSFPFFLFTTFFYLSFVKWKSEGEKYRDRLRKRMNILAQHQEKDRYKRKKRENMTANMERLTES